MSFFNLLKDTFPESGFLGIIDAECPLVDSEHDEGRALDWAVNANDPHQAAMAETVKTWLTETDEYGNAHALVRRFGVMIIIWNRQWFRSYLPSLGWVPYTGDSPHTDHVHFSFSWPGANKTVTGWHHEDSQPSGCRSYGDLTTFTNRAIRSLFRRSNATWYADESVLPPFGLQFGILNLDIPCSLDFNGSARDEFVVWRPTTGYWYVSGSSTGESGIKYGQADDIPVVTDTSANGVEELAVFRPSAGTWYVRGYFSAEPFGSYGDIPVPANYYTSGDQMAVFRPSESKWYVRVSLPGGVVYGQHGDVPVPADYNGAGLAEFAVWRPTSGRWFVSGVTSSSGVPFGQPGDVPVPADWDGNGDADFGLFRPSNATWYFDYNLDGIQDNVATVFGNPYDIAVPRRR